MTRKRKKSDRVRGRKSLSFSETALREAGTPLTVDQIIAHIRASGVSLDQVTKSQTPYNTISRDLALDICEKGEESRFVRVGLGVFTLRNLLPTVTAGNAGDVWTGDRVDADNQP